MRGLTPTRRATIILGATALAAGLTAWLTARGADTPEALEIKARLLRRPGAFRVWTYPSNSKPRPH